jgi:DNA-binding MarR family transcriptional regulator
MNTTQEAVINRAIDRFWEVVPPVWNQVRGHVRATAAEQFGVTVEQFHILRHIRKGIDSVSELATEKQISRPAISQAVDLLVEKGLISRHPHADDRRYVRLELTPDGDALLNAIFQKNREWMRTVFASMSAEDLDCLARGLAVLKDAFEAPFEKTSAAGAAEAAGTAGAAGASSAGRAGAAGAAAGRSGPGNQQEGGA